MSTKRYDISSGQIRNWYVGILFVDLDGIRNYHWNAERVIFFRWLFCSASTWCPDREPYVTGYPHILTCGTRVPTKSWYRIHTGQNNNFRE